MTKRNLLDVSPEASSLIRAWRMGLPFTALSDSIADICLGVTRPETVTL